MPQESKLPEETLEAIKKGELGKEIKSPKDIHVETKQERRLRHRGI